MKICPITYEQIPNKAKYSQKGLHLLSPRLSDLKIFPYSSEEQRLQAESLASKLSIQGIQPKISARLNVKERSFEIVEKGGTFILKPQVNHFVQVPENEDLTMRLAKSVGIEVPLHGLLYSKDGSLTYFVRRFDRYGKGKKIHLEDFAQLSGASRDTKYDSSMERVAEIMEQFCTFPAVEKHKLFQRTLFSFIVGNEDMHLKNFSLIMRDSIVSLSPAYDLLNTTIVLASPKEQLALPLKGKKNKITKADLLDYFGSQRLGLNARSIDAVLEEFEDGMKSWESTVAASFLSKTIQAQYMKLVKSRLAIFGINAF